MSDHEDLFARALSGELAWDADELEELRRESPEAARELDELFALQGTLDARERPGGTERPPAADLALVADTLDRLRREGGAAPERVTEPHGIEVRRALPGVLRLAAAVLLIALAGWWWSFESEGTREPDVPLGASTVFEAVSPIGKVDAFSEFRILAELSRMDSCELRIWDADTPEDAPTLLAPRRFRGTTWILTDDERDRLPERIRWELVVFDGQGLRIGGTAMILAERPAD